MKKYVVILMGMFITMGSVYAAGTDSSLQLVPESNTKTDVLGAQVNCVQGNETDCQAQKIDGKTVWDKYNSVADKKYNKDLGAQFATGIFSWNGIREVLIQAIKFLSGIALVIGAIMIIWSGYKYATGVFTGDVKDANKLIKNAIVGILIVIFSYAIIQALTAAFL